MRDHSGAGVRLRNGYRPIATAPRNGTVIIVRHGDNQDPVRAFWCHRIRSWVRPGDDTFEALEDVEVWRPIGKHGI
jgi:hypothetical protein